METGINLIAKERQEQIEKHGRSIEDDVKNNPNFELAFAARILLDPFIEKMDMTTLPRGWHPVIWTRLIEKPYKERLIISGALIAAEIDRATYLNM